MSTPQLLADVISIPTEVHRGEFVVSLEDGLTHAEAVLGTYVVTEQVADAFGQALGLVANAVDTAASRAAFLHASFGGGKSSLLAVLGLVLDGHPAARNKAGLAEVVAGFDRRTGHRRFLVVPVHMIGKASMEAAVLGAYVATVAARHPEAEPPAVFASDSLLATAAELRAAMGDEAFFARLGERPGGAGWGKLAAGWDAATYDAAVAAPGASPERERLVTAVVQRLLPSFATTARAAGSGYVEFADGLSAISRHARSLGYDAVVLLLDELILWLASHLADAAFADKEANKIGLLADAPAGQRPAPIVSFVARQRDLRDLVGDARAGADKLNVADQLSWWEGRFDTITLSDRNLPAVVAGRLLTPVSAAAGRVIDDAFTATTGTAGERVVDTLCTSAMDRTDFRRVYPFSPALIAALVDLSSVLQRERTALRVLVQLLVDRRAELRVGELIPLGDIYDVLATSDEPFSTTMKQHWQSARDLYTTRLRPVLLAEHDLTEDTVADLPAGHAFRGDDRLVKTLLLAALVPNCPVLHGLTVSRLAALNHGTIRAPLPGQERIAVLGKLRRWQVSVGELHLGEDTADPTVTLHVTGVDADAVIDKARGCDTGSERIRVARRMLLTELGVDDPDSLLPSRRVLWRGTRRTVDVVCGNVRDPAAVRDDAFRADGDTVRMVIDFPFDPDGGSTAADLARVRRVQAALDADPQATLVWLPQHLSEKTLGQLGTYITCEFLLTGNRFEQYAADLSADDRQRARLLVEARHRALRTTLLAALRMAYGIVDVADGVVLATLQRDEQWQCLDRTFAPERPVASGLADAFEKQIGAYLGHRYRLHPQFEEEVRVGDLRKVLEVVRAAARDRASRIDVADRALRKTMRAIANPLQLGTMHEAHYEPGTVWRDHVAQRLSEAGGAAGSGPGGRSGEALTVGTVRQWIDVPSPRGLTRAVQDLVILAWAATTDRVLRLHGARYEGDIDKLRDDAELHLDRLPDEATWTAATTLAAEVFGVTAGPLPSAAGQAALVAQVRAAAHAARSSCVELDGELRLMAARRTLPDTSDRLRTAAAARSLVEAIGGADDASVVGVLARATVPTTAAALGRSIATAAAVVGLLRTQPVWDTIASGERLGHLRPVEAEGITTLVNRALAADEHAVASGLASVVEQGRREAQHLVDSAIIRPPAGPEPEAVAAHGRADTATGREAVAAALAALQAKVAEGRARVTVTWTVDEPDAEPDTGRDTGAAS
jgi:hypothetical protein